MGAKRILLIEGDPDIQSAHLCGTLADAYAQGAQTAGHAVRRVKVAQLEFPLLRSQQEREYGSLPAGLQQAQQDIAWAQHLVLFFSAVAG